MAYDLGTAHGKIELEYTGRKQVDEADKDIKKVKKSAFDTDKALKKLGAALQGIGKGVAVGGIAVGMTNAGVAAANLAIQVAGIVPQLVSVGSLAAALPGLLVGAGVAAGVLKASLAGVGDAVKAAFETDPKKFEEALKKLSPAARTFAQSVRDAAPSLKQFQQGLQESFFQAGHFDSIVKKAVGTLKGMQGPLNGLAAQFGDLGRRVANFALSADSVTFVTSAIEHFKTGLDKASGGLIPMLTGLRDVGTVGLPLMDRLGAAVGRVGEQFGAWLTEVAGDGRLQQWIDTAIATLKTLGGILANVGSILSSVFQAAGETGGGLLNTIKTITGEFAAFLNSAKGSEAIRSLFTGIAAVAGALAPVITTLVGALAGALGPALATIATGVGPVLLQVVEALAPAFGPLATAIADVVTAVAPSLPALAQLVSMLAQLAGGALSTLATTMAPVISLLGGAFTAALVQLQPAIDQIVAQLPGFASAGVQLANALLPLVPAIVEFATAVTQALLPFLPQLMTSFQQLVPPIVQIATIMGGQLASSLAALIPYLPTIIGFLVGLHTTMFTLVAQGLSFVAFVLKVGQAIMGLPGMVGPAIAAFKNFIANAFNAVIALARQFPFRVGQGIGVLLSVLINGARIAWNGLKSAFVAGINFAVNTARTLPGRVRSAIAALPGQLLTMARTAWNNLRNAFSGGVGQATGVARTLPGRIKSAIGNLGSLLVGAGADAVRGLVNGLRGAIGSAVSAAAAVGKSVISGIKSTLKIGSPSKEMIKIGRFVTQGLVIGLLGTAKQVQAASNRLGNMVRDAFSDKLISKGARNSVLRTLDTGTKTLLSLVNRSNQIAARLKSAQSSLASVRKQYQETIASTAQKAKDSFALVGGGQNFLDLDTTKARFRDVVQQTKDFAADIAVLTKRGLSKDLIAQLLAAGAQEGGALADALANSSDANIREFVHIQNQMNKSANALGVSAANSLYGAGLKAAKGLVNGLASQQKQIEALMLRIAKSMEKAIKKALKIKSPSRIMFQLGRFTSEGLALGIESLRSQVEQAAKSLATATILPTVRLTTAGQVAGFMAPAPLQSRQTANHAEATNTTFGPYQLMLDGGVVAQFVIDTVTGNPKEVSKAASEGDRQNSWAGTGRRIG